MTSTARRRKPSCSKGFIRVQTKAALTIGQYRIEEPLTLFSSDKAGAFASDEQQGNIGQRILSKFKIYFDYAHNRLILEPNASFKAPIMPVIKVNRITGEIIGNVILKNCWKRVAPSIVAASYSCVGTPCSADR